MSYWGINSDRLSVVFFRGWAKIRASERERQAIEKVNIIDGTLGRC